MQNLAYKHNIDVICLQKTHISVDEVARFNTEG